MEIGIAVLREEVAEPAEVSPRSGAMHSVGAVLFLSPVARSPHLRYLSGRDILLLKASGFPPEAVVIRPVEVVGVAGGAAAVRLAATDALSEHHAGLR